MTTVSNSAGKLVTHSSIYFAGNLLRHAVSFIMLPIYTRYLTTADYGTIELLSTILDFTGIIVGMRIAEALFRFYSEYEEVHQKNEVITTGLLLVAFLNVVGVCAIWAFSKPLTLLLFDSGEAAGLLVLFSFTLVGAAVIEIPMIYLRALQRPWVFVAFSTLKLVTQLSLNVYFIVFRGMRVEGVVYSSVLATILISVPLLIYTLRRTGCRFSMEKAKKLMSFSLPLIFTSIIGFYIVFGDRYFLKFYSGLSEVGIYSLGYKFGFLLGFVVVSPFFSIWQSERYALVKQKNAEDIMRDVMLVFSIALVLFVVILSIMVRDILRVMSVPSFWPAYRVVPLILAAYAFDALTNYTMLGILLQKRTGLIAYGNLISAAVITGGYVVLIPRMGAMGAALASLFAYLVRFLWITRESQKLYRLTIPWKQISLVSIAGLVTYGVSQFGPEELFASVLFNLSLSMVFVASIFLFPILPPGWRKEVTRTIMYPREMIGYFRSLKS